MGGNLGPSFLFLLLGGGWMHCVSSDSDCDNSMASSSASWQAFGYDSGVALVCSSSGGGSWGISVEGDFSAVREHFSLPFFSLTF